MSAGRHARPELAVPVKSFEVVWEGPPELGNFLAELYREAIDAVGDDLNRRGNPKPTDSTNGAS